MDTKRVVDIILAEAMEVEERFDGYREELKELVAEIINIEQKHQFVSRNVRKEIAEQINKLGKELSESKAKTAEESA